LRARHAEHARLGLETAFREDARAGASVWAFAARARVPRHPRRAADDGPVLALELRAWAPRRRLCRVAALRARQLPQLPACGRWVPRGWQTHDAVPRRALRGPLQLRVALGHALPEGTRAGVGVGELRRAPGV